MQTKTLKSYYVLKNGSKCSIKETIKKSKINYVVLACESKLLGKFYFTIRYKDYYKLSKMKSFKLSYNFLDGIYEDDRDEAYIKTKYIKNCNKINDLLGYLMDIRISETVFRNNFWITMSEPCYNFTNVKVICKVKKKKKTSYSVKKFINKFRIFDVMDRNRFVKLSTNSNTGKSISMIEFYQVFENVFIPINRKILTKKIKTKFKIKIANFFEEMWEFYSSQSKLIDFHPTNLQGIFDFLVYRTGNIIIPYLETDILHEPLYKTKWKLFDDNKNKINTTKFVNKYFPYLDNRKEEIAYD